MLSLLPSAQSKYSTTESNYYTSAWKEKYLNTMARKTLEVCKPNFRYREEMEREKSYSSNLAKRDSRASRNCDV